MDTNSNIIPEAMLDIFELQRVTTPHALSESLRVRFEVYCQELGFEHAQSFPDAQEHDAYDVHADHVILIHRPTGVTAGSVRMIDSRAVGTQGLPIFAHAAIDPTCPIDPLRHSCCEVSRLAVRPQFRRHGQVPSEIACLGKEWGEAWDADRELFRYIGPLLFVVGLTLWLDSDTDAAFILARPALVRRMAHWGVCFDPAGPEISFRGIRQPFCFNHQNVTLVPPHLWNMIRRMRLLISDKKLELCPSYH